MPAFDENPKLSKYAAWQTQYFGEILHFQGQMFVKRCKLYFNLLTGPLIKIIFEGRWTILKERAF